MGWEASTSFSELTSCTSLYAMEVLISLLGTTVSWQLTWRGLDEENHLQHDLPGGGENAGLGTEQDELETLKEKVEALRSSHLQLPAVFSSLRAADRLEI